MTKKPMPLETKYNGYKFRSRLEARWAVFFDVLRVKYEYEPQGFLLPSGKTYLPDFKVKCYGTRGDAESKPFDLWIEVKGNMTEDDAERIREFAISKEKTTDEYLAIENPILIVGDIPHAFSGFDSEGTECYDSMNGYDICPFNYELIDGDYFGAYPAATPNGHFYLMGDDSNYINEEDLSRVERAYEKARQARFEHRQ